MIMAVLVVSFRGRTIVFLLRPVFFARKVFLALHPNVDLGRRNAAADDARNLQPRPYAQSRHGFFQYSGRNSGIDERAQKHVAAHAGETFKIGNAHNENSSLVVSRWSLGPTTNETGERLDTTELSS